MFCAYSWKFYHWVPLKSIYLYKVLNLGPQIMLLTVRIPGIFCCKITLGCWTADIFLKSGFCRTQHFHFRSSLGIMNIPSSKAPTGIHWLIFLKTPWSSGTFYQNLLQRFLNQNTSEILPWFYYSLPKRFLCPHPENKRIFRISCSLCMKKCHIYIFCTHLQILYQNWQIFIYLRGIWLLLKY